MTRAPLHRDPPRAAAAAFAIALAATTLVAGCAAVHRPPATVESLTADGARLGAEHRATIDSVIDRLARRAMRRGDRTLDLLFLSGGGQNGAYGAGFLRGWASRTDAPIPRFDLVTGVSTGALQSPFATVGTAAAYDTLSALYLRAADEFAPKVDWWFWLRRTGGVVKTERYERAIAAILDEGMRDRLRAAFAEDRQLAVATVDYDLAIGRLWDLSRVLEARDTTGEARARALAATRKVVYASTAIPGAFPPIVLDDGHVHGDGGTVSNVLTVLDLADYRRLAERLRARGVLADGDAEPVTVRLWVIMNLWTHMAPTPVDIASRKDIQARGNLLSYWSQQPQLVERLHTLGLAVSRDVPGLRLDVRATVIPSDVTSDPAAQKLFDRAFMARLDSLGYARARSATPWDSVTSPYERPPASTP